MRLANVKSSPSGRLAQAQTPAEPALDAVCRRVERQNQGPAGTRFSGEWGARRLAPHRVGPRF